MRTLADRHYSLVYGHWSEYACDSNAVKRRSLELTEQGTATKVTLVVVRRVVPSLH